MHVQFEERGCVGGMLCPTLAAPVNTAVRYDWHLTGDH